MTDRIRHASCRCGQIRIACTGEPIRVSVCHCRNCKARSGSAFAAQARFPAANVRTEGEAKLYQHAGGSGIAYLWEQQLLNTPVPAQAK